MVELAIETRDSSYKDMREGICPKQAAILEVLKRKPTLFHPDDMTNSEIARSLGWGINSVTGRVYELREMNLVGPSTKRTCGVTGRRCQAWKII
jgi:DNA-binding MarR family transcriptional regulator